MFLVEALISLSQVLDYRLWDCPPGVFTSVRKNAEKSGNILWDAHCAARPPRFLLRFNPLVRNDVKLPKLI